MKFLSEKAPLKKAFEVLGKVVKSRTVIPILANAKLELSGNDLTITTTDLDLSASVRLTVDGVEDGVTTLPAEEISAMVKAFADGSSIEVKNDGDGFRISSGRSRYKLPCIAASDFPAAFNRPKDAVVFTVPATELMRLLAATAPFCGIDATRFYLQGVMLESAASTLNAVATNGHVLAVCRMASDVEIPQVIVPRETVELVKSAISGEDITIAVSATIISFRLGDITIESKLIDGKFPDYSRIIPEGGAVSFEADCRDLKVVTSRVGLIGSKESSAVKVSLDNTCVLSAVNGHGGEATDEVTLLGSTGKIELGVSSIYLQAVCAAMGDGPVVFTMRDPTSPMLITPSGDDSVLYVVMPMRI